ncbi:hypothetical protein [Bacillus sp. CGMCC 1.16541]|uniref:hypothetical protein n=1 Tax=Bacillus sp. CGMCC 1.16541 TaxID=2185143 RepID=UPI000D73FED9|nr:hypothetical protein [Bacillus sp. CGMCC 1.16541]
MKQEWDKYLKKAKASLEAEGLKIEEHHIKLVKKNLDGEITDEEFNEEVIKMAKAKWGIR